MRLRLKRNPAYEPLPLDAALGLAKAILGQVDMLLQSRPNAYSDWNEVLIDAAMNLRTGFTSLDAPEEDLSELLEDNRMFAKNVFASVASAVDF
jgi:hypothetical protein